MIHLRLKYYIFNHLFFYWEKSRLIFLSQYKLSIAFANLKNPLFEISFLFLIFFFYFEKLRHNWDIENKFPIASENSSKPSSVILLLKLLEKNIFQKLKNLKIICLSQKTYFMKSKFILSILLTSIKTLESLIISSSSNLSLILYKNLQSNSYTEFIRIYYRQKF